MSPVRVQINRLQRDAAHYEHRAIRYAQRGDEDKSRILRGRARTLQDWIDEILEV